MAILRVQEKKTLPGLIELNVAELCRLLAKQMKKTYEALAQILYWSYWKRRHQYHAQQSHYRRRENLLPTELLRL
ncbi:hypothetical protein KKJ14_12655 [Xenorhabdus bovienii]|nr:hypothetical protein [Xenorhabdus bovienii]MDE9535241.1 hypothetical protein [Xenorhabdus bovienii]MDE9588557.1 hypothetical protein [Xenorhabdus bovienii]